LLSGKNAEGVLPAERDILDFRFSIFDFRLGTSCQLPVASCQLPVSLRISPFVILSGFGLRPSSLAIASVPPCLPLHPSKHIIPRQITAAPMIRRMGPDMISATPLRRSLRMIGSASVSSSSCGMSGTNGHWLLLPAKVTNRERRDAQLGENVVMDEDGITARARAAAGPPPPALANAPRPLLYGRLAAASSQQRRGVGSPELRILLHVRPRPDESGGVEDGRRRVGEGGGCGGRHGRGA